MDGRRTDADRRPARPRAGWPPARPDRIGAIGICLGGGYALKFAAFDPRVRAFAGIAGAYNSPQAMRTGIGPDGYRQTLAQFTAAAEDHDTAANFSTSPP